MQARELVAGGREEGAASRIQYCFGGRPGAGRGRLTVTYAGVAAPPFRNAIELGELGPFTLNRGEETLAGNPGEAMELAAGRWTLRAGKYPVMEVVRAIEIGAGETREARIEFVAADALLEVTVPSRYRGAEVLIDGDAVTPELPGGYRVQPGRHTVTVDHPLAEGMSIDVDISSGQTATVRFPG